MPLPIIAVNPPSLLGGGGFVLQEEPNERALLIFCIELRKNINVDYPRVIYILIQGVHKVPPLNL